MPTKLGFHLQNASVFQIERLGRMKPRAILVVKSPEALNAAYQRLGAGPVYAHDLAIADDTESFIAAHRSIAEAVESFMTRHDATFRALRWAYHLGLPTQKLTPEVAKFEALLIQTAAERLNVRLCVGNFASGQAVDWSLYQPVLEAAERYQALIGLRERYPILPYAGFGPNANRINPTTIRLQNEIAYPQGYQGLGQFVGGYRALRDFCRQKNIPLRILVCEIGAGYVYPLWQDRFGQNVGDWRTLANVWRQFGITEAPETRYLRDLIWLDQHVYSGDAEVLATCVYTWNSAIPNADISAASSLLDRLQSYMLNAQRNQGLPYEEKAFKTAQSYRVIVPSLRVRSYPSLNTQNIGNLSNGEVFTATHYTFYDGMLWLKHRGGWSVYTQLVKGDPDYDNKYVDGQAITTPRQDASISNFVGTIEEVRRFMEAHRESLFFIDINPSTPPEGARQFKITAFPVKDARQAINTLHPEAGDPLITPKAREILKNAGFI